MPFETTVITVYTYLILCVTDLISSEQNIFVNSGGILPEVIFMDIFC